MGAVLIDLEIEGDVIDDVYRIIVSSCYCCCAVLLCEGVKRRNKAEGFVRGAQIPRVGVPLINLIPHKRLHAQ